MTTIQTDKFDLLNLAPQKISTDMSSYTMLVYGNPKIGKTTFVHDVYGNDAIILATEKGYKALAGAYVLDIGNWSDFIKANVALKKPEIKAKFKTVIIDTVDLLYTYVERYVLSKNGVDKLNEIPYGGGWSEISTTLFDGLQAIEREGYNLAFISHATTKTETVPNSEQEYEKYIPTVSKRGLAIVTKMVDNILFAAVGVDAEGNQKRVLYSRETMQWQAGVRFKAMAPVFDLTAEAYAKAMIDAIEAEGKHNLKSEKEVSFVQIETNDFDELMARAKQAAVKFHKAGRMPEVNSIVEKNFGAGKKLTEATASQIESLIIAVQELEELIK